MKRVQRTKAIGAAGFSTRSGEPIVLPGDEMRLARGDALLFAGTTEARALQSLIAHNIKICDYVHLGVEAREGLVWRIFSRRRAQSAAAERN